MSSNREIKNQLKRALNAQRECLRERGWLLSPTLLNTHPHRHRVQYYFYARAFEGDLATAPHMRLVYTLTRENKATVSVDLLAPDGECEAFSKDQLDPSNTAQVWEMFASLILDPTNLEAKLRDIDARRAALLREIAAHKANGGAR